MASEAPRLLLLHSRAINSPAQQLVGRTDVAEWYLVGRTLWRAHVACSRRIQESASPISVVLHAFGPASGGGVEGLQTSTDVLRPLINSPRLHRSGPDRAPEMPQLLWYERTKKAALL